MKYCPLCEATYGDEVALCEHHEPALTEIGSNQDSFIGRLIKGRYRIVKKLGEGGMGAVYLAEQLSIRRWVALKVLRRQYATDDEFVRRFRREALLAASLKHRNVITVYDFDQVEEGSLFIVMEYVEGKSLREIIKGGSLEIERAVGLGIQIAEGLGAAHRAGIIHRDIKPENIMVVGEEEEAKILDFGIARLRDTGTATQLTIPGRIMGTPFYISPEQIEGREISERTDLYALGIVIYEMLTGRVPFAAATPGGVLTGHLEATPVPPKALRPEIPSWLQQVVMQALEKEPEMRPRGMHQFIQGLKKSGEPLPAGGPSRGLKRQQPLPAGNVIKVLRGSRLLLGAAIIIGATVASWSILRHESWIAWRQTSKSPEAKVVPLEIPSERRELKVQERAAPRVGEKYSDSTEKEIQPPPQPPLVSLRVLADKRVVKINERLTLRLGGQYSDGSQTEITKKVRWQSSDRSVAAVDPFGQVEGFRQGKTLITARYSDIESPPFTLMVKGTTKAKGPVSKGQASNIRVKDHIKIARFYRGRGEYVDAFSELEKAISIDPANKEVLAELVNTKQACSAEKELGRGGLPC